MRRLAVYEWSSLDQVVQAPGAPDEDPDGGFRHGGWHLAYFDDASRAWVEGYLERADAFLFGRRTWETFAAHWPHAGEAEQVIARPLNTRPKYVASTTLATADAWQRSTVLGGDLVSAVTALKQQDGGEIQVIGSAQLVRTLLAHDLVDEVQLMVDPVLLGGGKRIWPEDGRRVPLELAECRPTSTGALLLSYRRATGG